MTALWNKSLEAGLPEAEILKVFEWCQEVVDVIPPPEDEHRPPPNDKSQGPGGTHGRPVDSEDSQRARSKQKRVLKTNWLDDVQPEKPEYLDPENKLFPKGKLITLSGPKGSLKSSGVMTYLLHQNLKGLYYSDGELTEGQVKAIQNDAQRQGAKGRVGYAPIDALDLGKEFDDYLIKEVATEKVDFVWEDPAPEEKFGTIQSTRPELKRRGDLAGVTNASWLVSRNYRKDRTKVTGDNITGFGLWRNMPRAVLITTEAEPGSADFLDATKKTKGGETLVQMSMLYSEVTNIGKRPDVAVVFRLIETKELEKFIELETIPRPKKPEDWGKATTQAERDKKETETHRILFHISEVSKNNKKGGFDSSTEGISSGELRNWMIEELAFSRAKAVRKIAELKIELIQGGGKGAKNPLTLTNKGKKMVED